MPWLPATFIGCNKSFAAVKITTAYSATKVWDVKFPMVVLPHSAMHDDDVFRLHTIEGKAGCYFVRLFVMWHSKVAAEVHRRVAELAAWSMKCALKGVFPAKGLNGEDFDPKSLRFKMKGQPLGVGWRLVSG